MDSAMESDWVVYKFGGTSVATGEKIAHVARVCQQAASKKKAVVVSAMGGVTDKLIHCMNTAKAHEPFQPLLEELLDMHVAACGVLGLAGGAVEASIRSDVDDLGCILKAVWLSRGYSANYLATVCGYGELWSSLMLHAHMSEMLGERSARVDARTIVFIRDGETGPVVLWERTQAAMDAWLAEAAAASSPPDVVVMPGFVASYGDGTATTLQRDGSDFSASILGAVLRCREIVIWTDVDGVFSADPRYVPDAFQLDYLSYDEAAELSYFGARVIHPNTMMPAIRHAIPIYIRNTAHPERVGTKIHTPRRYTPRSLAPSAMHTTHGDVIKGLTIMRGLVLVNIEGMVLRGVAGIAQRIFAALKDAGVSVVLISQASSEHSVCVAVPDEHATRARDAVAEAFKFEVHMEQMRIEVVREQSVLACVGDGMKEVSGIAARLMQAVADVGASLRAIAQGSSERNISCVVDTAVARRALRAAHDAFFSSSLSIAVGVVGCGLIGKQLLMQLNAQREWLARELGVCIRVRAVCSSRRMVLSSDDDAGALDAHVVEELAGGGGEAADLHAFVRHVQGRHHRHAMLVDCTASDAVAEHYKAWLGTGLHVVTPNKKAFSGPLPRFRAIMAALASGKHRVHCMYEATVGAGLPVLAPLRELVKTGHRVQRIEGVFSGTLSYLFNTLSDGSGATFSEAVADAKARGFTEPDPRDDLNGMDVARKVVILARTCGMEVSLADIAIESLVPEPLRAVESADAFLAALPAHDAAMTQRLADAAARGSCLRYVGCVDVAAGTCSVGLREYAAAHALGGLRGADNMVVVETAWYTAANPLIIRGPGAGASVTAAGVFGDMLKVASMLGGRV